MVKYNIEGNIDFYDELYKSLDIEENNHKTDEDLSLCLITKELLVDKYFTMDCGHKFNYLPLFNDIKNHKQKFNGFEVAKGQLKIDEIRCPYCRNKQKGVLPYYEELLLGKINGVNYICDILKNKKELEKLNLCQFLIKNGNNSDNSNQELVKCNKIGHKIDFKYLKENSYPFNQTQIEIVDPNHYCYKHKNQKTKEYKNYIIYNIKQDLKIKKIKEKDDLKIKKIKEKEDLKIAKISFNQKDFTNLYTNMVINYKITNQKKNILDTSGNHLIDVSSNEYLYDPSGNNSYDMSYNDFLYDNVSSNNIVINSTLNNVSTSSNNASKCVEIIKTGKNKGNNCGCKSVIDNLCQRHYNLKNKTTNNIII